jgi:membrane-associated phospholipid phosphatase/predicted RNA binding protein YcfA (HicA-like mRNA interferase family)
MNSIKNILLQWEHRVWYFINTQCHNFVLDSIVPFFRNQWFWTPIYLYLAVVMPARFRWRGLWWCLAFILAFALSDQISATWLKPYFHRLRPCQDPVFWPELHELVPCGGLYGFPSSHASNHFAVGIFAAVTLRKYVKWIVPVAIGWASLVAFAQVYVGVHFPYDVAFGAMIGTTLGCLIGWAYNKYIGLEGDPAQGDKMLIALGLKPRPLSPLPTFGELLTILKTEGWQVVRQGGGHVVLKNPAKSNQMTIPTGESGKVNRELLGDILIDAGIKTDHR